MNDLKGELVQRRFKFVSIIEMRSETTIIRVIEEEGEEEFALKMGRRENLQ